MMLRTRQIIVASCTAVLVLGALAPISVYAAEQLPAIVPTDCATAGQGTNKDVMAACGLNAMFQTIINVTDIILALTGSAALLMFTYAGLTFIIAAGSQEKISKAKEVLEAAVIGIAIILLGWTMVHLTIITITGGEIGSSAKIFNTNSPTANPNASN
jgi:hypothetical protein